MKKVRILSFICECYSLTSADVESKHSTELSGYHLIECQYIYGLYMNFLIDSDCFAMYTYSINQLIFFD